ncbi:MAG: hypothetical protein P4L96_11610 [Rhodoferax sp.]|nr:hypothetical protein [Rhodoferax sp.]
MDVNTVRLHDRLRQHLGADLAAYKTLHRWLAEHVSAFYQTAALAVSLQSLRVKKLMPGRAFAEAVNKDACANPAAFDGFVAYAAQREHAE